MYALFAGLMTTAAVAQNNVGIGTNSPDPSAVLDMQSASQGVLVPRMTTAQRNAIATPAEGLLVYDTDVDCFFFYESSAAAWENLCSAGATGPQGPQGPAGGNGVGIVSTVDNGDGTYTFNYSDGTNFTTSDLTGPAGTAGAQGPQGPSGVIQKYHVYGTAGRLGVTSSVAAAQPGLSQTFTLSAPATVMVWATIGARTTVTTSGSYAIVDMILYVNGNFLPNGGWNRFNVVNPSNANSFNTCAINTMISLPAGTHTIDLRTLRGLSSTSPVDIGGDSSVDTNPGELTLLILN